MVMALTVVLLGTSSWAEFNVWSRLILKPLVLLHQKAKLVLVFLVIRLSGEGNISIESFTGYSAWRVW